MLKRGFVFREVMLAFALLMMSFGGGSLLAQSTTDGAISVTVTDASGAAVAGANVTLRNNGTSLEQTVQSDDTGYIRVAKLQPTSYTVRVEAAGMAPFTSENVIVQVGTVTDLFAKLNIASAGATVVVSAESPVINTDSQEFSGIVSREAIGNLPINNGRWSSFALLTPGAVNDSSGFGLISFRGISTLLNNSTVDGGDNNQAFFSEERGRTRIGYTIPKAAVQEFQVNTSNYSAEYGRAAGAVINTVTKSGSNQFHGEAYFYDRDNEWGATNPFTRLTTQTSPGVFTSAPYKPKDVRKIWGGGIGGPVLKDRLFFYFAVDRYDRDFPGTAVPGSPAAFFASPVPDLTPYGGSCGADDASKQQPESGSDQELRPQRGKHSDRYVGRVHNDVAARETRLRQRSANLQRRLKRPPGRTRSSTAKGPGDDFSAEGRLGHQQPESRLV